LLCVQLVTKLSVSLCVFVRRFSTPIPELKKHTFSVWKLYLFSNSIMICLLCITDLKFWPAKCHWLFLFFLLQFTGLLSCRNFNPLFISQHFVCVSDHLEILLESGYSLTYWLNLDSNLVMRQNSVKFKCMMWMWSRDFLKILSDLNLLHSIPLQWNGFFSH
jgi:hypothetical protein